MNDDIIYYISKFLEFKSIKSMMLVSSNFRKIISSNPIDHIIYFKSYCVQSYVDIVKSILSKYNFKGYIIECFFSIDIISNISNYLGKCDYLELINYSGSKEEKELSFIKGLIKLSAKLIVEIPKHMASSNWLRMHYESNMSQYY